MLVNLDDYRSVDSAAETLYRQLWDEARASMSIEEFREFQRNFYSISEY